MPVVCTFLDNINKNHKLGDCIMYNSQNTFSASAFVLAFYYVHIMIVVLLKSFKQESSRIRYVASNFA